MQLRSDGCFISSLAGIIIVIAIERLQGMSEDKTADLISLFDSVLDGGAKVNTGINARCAVLGGCLGKARKGASQAGKWRAACSRERYIVGMEKPAQYLRSSTA